MLNKLKFIFNNCCDIFSAIIQTLFTVFDSKVVYTVKNEYRM